MAHGTRVGRILPPPIDAIRVQIAAGRSRHLRSLLPKLLKTSFNPTRFHSPPHPYLMVLAALRVTLRAESGTVATALMGYRSPRLPVQEGCCEEPINAVRCTHASGHAWLLLRAKKGPRLRNTTFYGTQLTPRAILAFVLKRRTVTEIAGNCTSELVRRT